MQDVCYCVKYRKRIMSSFQYDETISPPNPAPPPSDKQERLHEDSDTLRLSNA